MAGYALAMENTGEYLARFDVYVQYTRLPSAVNGCVTTVNGEPVALINEERPVPARIRAVAHEIEHVRRGDLSEKGDVRTMEGRRKR